MLSERTGAIGSPFGQICVPRNFVSEIVPNVRGRHEWPARATARNVRRTAMSPCLVTSLRRVKTWQKCTDPGGDELGAGELGAGELGAGELGAGEMSLRT